MTEWDPPVDDLDDDEDAESPMEAMRRQAVASDAFRYRGPVESSDQLAAAAAESPKSKKPKEPMLKQWLVQVIVLEDADVNPNATVANARDHVWTRYGNAGGRFHVTRADAGKVMWQEAGEDEAEFDQLRFVCDYVAKGANADDAKKRLVRELKSTGITVLNVDVTETASLRAAEPYAVPEDLPSLTELRQIVDSHAGDE
ncbi:hypothetical protein [Blastococcus sp. SYSU DS0533]